MKDEPLSFKEKYLRLRERFDRVSATQRQYTNDLQAARLKARKLKEENNHLLDILSDMQQMAGSGLSSDSDTSFDDLSDLDDDDDDDFKDEGHGDSRHGRSSAGRADVSDNNRQALSGRGRRDTTSSHGLQMSRDVTSMTDSSNISTVGVANGGYNNQMDNRPANINTSNTSNQAPSRAGALVKKEKPEGAPKQTRRATKRADRGRPRAVVPLPTNPDGSLNYPIVVGKGTNEVIIENMGRIVWQGRGYHNHRYIFPVGFRSKKQYTSLSDTSKKTYFINEILDGGEQPIFQITLEDMPEKVFRHSSSSGAWELALKGLMELGYNAKTHASGPDMYGLTNLGVIKYIQEMPNAHRCRRYMPLKWIIEDDSLGSPSNGDPSGSKSPGRKKKINNSLYASNHEVLMETLEEAEKAAQSSGSSTARPYTPRKYTKRKASQDQTPAPELMEIEHIPPLALLPSVSETEPAMGHMEGVKHERDQHLGALPVRDEEAIKTTDVAPHTPQSMGRQEQYFSGMSHDQENKISIHRYDHSYGQPLMEP